jgi:hypothetical protein
MGTRVGVTRERILNFIIALRRVVSFTPWPPCFLCQRSSELLNVVLLWLLVQSGHCRPILGGIIPLCNPIIAIIMRGRDSHNTTIFAILLNVSTTCFGHCWVGYRQVEDKLSENTFSPIYFKTKSRSPPRLMYITPLCIILFSQIIYLQPDDGHLNNGWNM